MKLLRGIVWAIVLMVAVAGFAQSAYHVEVGQTLTIELPGSTAAYALVSDIAEVTAANGVIQVHGRSVGETSIIVVTPSGITRLQLTVDQAAAVLAALGQMKTPERSERGSYIFQYGSSPQQVSNTLDYTRQIGQSSQHFFMTTTSDIVSSSNVTAIPNVSFEVHTPLRDITLLDQVVNNSDLTLNDVSVRGIHYSQGPWSFQAGYGSLFSFQNVFLATDPEWVYGATRRFKLGQFVEVAGNVYYFKNPSSQAAQGMNGAVGTVYYRVKHPDWTSQAELGLGRSVAAAIDSIRDSPGSHIQSSLRYVPRRFASLALNTQHGLFGNFNATQDIRGVYSLDFSGAVTNYDLPYLRQDTMNVRGQVTRKLPNDFSISVGGGYARYVAKLPPAAAFQNVSIPISIAYTPRRFSVALQDQPTSDLAGHFGNGYAASGGFVIRKGLSANASWQQAVDIPTVSGILAQLPELQEILLRQGIVSASLDQVLTLLQNSAYLNSLGFGNLIGITEAPRRNDVSAGIDWTSSGMHMQRLSFTYLDSKTSFVNSSLHFQSASFIYSRRLTATNDLSGSISLYRTDMMHQSAQLNPSFQVSLRHNLSSLPFPTAFRHHGMVYGYVFEDPQARGLYLPGDKGLANIEVVLDDAHVTKTDERGYYVFNGVPYGHHTVLARVESVTPFAFTTNSPANTEVGSPVYFGIQYLSAQVFGHIRNDGGTGVANVTVLLSGANNAYRTVTGSDGSFQFAGLQDGDYILSTVIDSYPTGYELTDIKDETVTVKAGSPVRADHAVLALRTVTGVVSTYDTTLLKNVPIANAVVEIPALHRVTKTNREGRFSFSELPSGNYTVEAHTSEQRLQKPVVLSPEPITIRNFDFALPKR